MRRTLVSAVGIFLLILPSCRSSEPIPETTLDREDPEITQLVQAFLAAGLAGDSAASAAMYVEEIRSLEGFERVLVETSEVIKVLGEPLALSYVKQIPGGSGIAYVYHVEFSNVTGRIFADLEPGSGLLRGVFFDPLPAGQTVDPRDRFEARVFRRDSEVLPYRLLKPKAYDPGERYPLVLFLHGAGQRGDDNIQQVANGIWGFSNDDIREQHPCFVVAPQCPSTAQWVDTPWSADSHAMPKHPTWPLRLSLELVDALQDEFSIDEDRIYVTGLSMGGFGTWDAIQRYPERFAAAVPICGGGDTAYAEQIAGIPIWAYHGDKDTVVIVERSRDMIAAITDAGGEPRYTELPDVGHDSWTAAYTDDAVFAWMFAQSRSGR